MAMQYSASGAAKASGKNVATITRAIKSGKISASKDGGGAWRIDPAELHRVFPPVAQTLKSLEVQRYANPIEEDKLGANNVLTLEVAALRERLAVAEAVAEERTRALEATERNLADLRRLLPPPPSAGPARPWWRLWS